MVDSQVTAGRAVVEVLRCSARAGLRRGMPVLGADLLLSEIARQGSNASPGPLSQPMSDLDAALRRVSVHPTGAGTDRDNRESGHIATVDVDAMLREVLWEVTVFTKRGLRFSVEGANFPQWSDAVREALAAALTEAASAGVSRAGPTHLMLGLLSDPVGPVATMLPDTKLNRLDLIELLRADVSCQAEAEPYAPLVRLLESVGGIDAPMPWVARRLVAHMRHSTTRTSRYRNVVMPCFEVETRGRPY